MLVVIILYTSQVIGDLHEMKKQTNHTNIAKKRVLGRGNSMGKAFELGYAWQI